MTISWLKSGTEKECTLTPAYQQKGEGGGGKGEEEGEKGRGRGNGGGGEKRGGRREVEEGGRKGKGGEKERREVRKRGGSGEKEEGGEKKGREGRKRGDETRRCAYSRCPSCKLRPSNHEGVPTLLTRHCPLPQIVGPLGVYTSFLTLRILHLVASVGAGCPSAPRNLYLLSNKFVPSSCGPRRSRASKRSRASCS